MTSQIYDIRFFPPGIMAIVLLAVELVSPVSLAAAERQELTRENFRSSICNIASMNVSFKIDEAFGEPLITSQMKWTAGPNTSNNCLSGITHLWVRVRTELDAIRYIKLRPEVLEAGQGFGATATESPSWAFLFCNSPSDSATCESVSSSKRLYASNLKFETLEVVTEALAISTLNPPDVSSNADKQELPGKETDSTAFSLESMLADAIDDAIDPNAQSREDEIKETAKADAQKLAVLEQQNSLETRAKQASQNIVSLISSSLSRYNSPPHNCESGRSVANWVQMLDTCQLNFRSESSHDYLCGDKGKPEPIKTTSQTPINFQKDVDDIPEIRHSPDGWASLILELSDDINRVTEGNYQTNRWQLTVDDTKLEELKQLAGSLVILKEYCEDA